MKTEKLVLATGVAVFIAVHCIIQLLNDGYHIKATLRNLDRQAAVSAMLREGGIDAGDRLSFLAADLSSDENWNEAVKDCTYVIHVASPTPKLNFTDEDKMIIPAREGVLRVLRAARMQALNGWY